MVVDISVFQNRWVQYKENSLDWCGNFTEKELNDLEIFSIHEMSYLPHLRQFRIITHEILKLLERNFLFKAETDFILRGINIELEFIIRNGEDLEMNENFLLERYKFLSLRGGVDERYLRDEEEHSVNKQNYLDIKSSFEELKDIIENEYSILFQRYTNELEQWENLRKEVWPFYRINTIEELWKAKKEEKIDFKLLPKVDNSIELLLCCFLVCVVLFNLKKLFSFFRKLVNKFRN